MTNATQEGRMIRSVNGGPIRRGSMVETDDGGIGHYVGTTSAGIEVVCYRVDRFADACRRFDSIRRSRRNER